MESLEFSIGAIALFTFLTISAVAGMISEYKKRRLAIDVLRTAIEHGQPLDPALIDRLSGKEKEYEEEGAPLQPLSFRIGGIVTIATGIGIALLAFFVFVVFPTAFYPVIGLGVLIVCIGISLLISARVVERDQKSRASDQPGK